MSAPAVAAPIVLAEPGQPECGERHESEHARCARPPRHKGGHLSRDRKCYWQAKESQS